MNTFYEKKKRKCTWKSLFRMDNKIYTLTAKKSGIKPIGAIDKVNVGMSEKKKNKVIKFCSTTKIDIRF